MLDDLAARFGAAQAARLVGIYGGAAAEIAKRAQRELATPLAGAESALVAELVYALEVEWAATLADVLQRRCMEGLRADFGLKAAAAASGWLERLGIWDKARAEAELTDYRELAARHRARPLA